MKASLFDRLAAPLKHRIAMMVSRAIVTLVEDTGGIQALQLAALDGELLEGAERFQDYGFTSVPFPDAEAVVVFPGGLRSHPLIVACGDRRYRLKGLQGGEVAIYDDQDQAVILKREGIRVQSPLKVEIEAPEVTLTATTKASIVAPSIVLDGVVDLGGEGGKFVGRHDDAIVAGKIVATSTRVRAK
jgi:phage baseplate assembly protein V